jgi:hypothetical protein
MDPIETFLSQLENVPWFENIGKKIDPNAKVERIWSWAEWPGPEEASVIGMHLQLQDLFDEITGNGTTKELVSKWEQIQAGVVQVASSRVPYDSAEDSWYAPNVAVWQAGWTAGVIGLSTQLGRTVPNDIKKQWDWFVFGHWPCDWNDVTNMPIVF